MQAEENTYGWCELEQVLPDDRRRTVYVNAHAVRSVVDDGESRADWCDALKPGMPVRWRDE